MEEFRAARRPMGAGRRNIWHPLDSDQRRDGGGAEAQVYTWTGSALLEARDRVFPTRLHFVCTRANRCLLVCFIQ